MAAALAVVTAAADPEYPIAPSAIGVAFAPGGGQVPPSWSVQTSGGSFRIHATTGAVLP